jgi:hypothetical protein
VGSVVGKVSLSHAQSVIGLLAGVTSIAGAVYSAMRWVDPPAPTDVVAVVRSAGSDDPIPGATVDVFTAGNAVVTTLTTGDDGRAHHPLAEGPYVVHVKAQRYEEQTRVIQVQHAAAAEIRFDLASRVATAHDARPGATAGVGRTVSKSVGGVQRFFQRLGL